jgi:hypothetical protein
MADDFSAYHASLFAGLGIKTEQCASCHKSVYAAERVVVNKIIYHQTCLRCTTCKTTLQPRNLNSHNGQFFCQRHIMQQLSRPITKSADGDFEKAQDADQSLLNTAATSVTKNIGTSTTNTKYAEITFDEPFDYDVAVVNFEAANDEDQLFHSDWEFFQRAVTRKGFRLQVARTGEGNGWDVALQVNFVVVAKSFALALADSQIEEGDKEVELAVAQNKPAKAEKKIKEIAGKKKIVKNMSKRPSALPSLKFMQAQVEAHNDPNKKLNNAEIALN